MAILTLEITLSPQLFELLEDKLPNLGRRMERAITRELGAEVRRSTEISVTASAAKGADTATEAPQMPVENAEPAKAKVYTREDMRAAIDDARHRIMGAGADAKESEEYKRYHRVLNQQFKAISMQIAQCTPASLPDDKLEQFCRECRALKLNEAGEIVTEEAPF